MKLTRPNSVYLSEKATFYAHILAKAKLLLGFLINTKDEQREETDYA